MTISTLINSKYFHVALVIISTLLTTLQLQSFGFFTRIESATFDHRVGLFRSEKDINENVVIILIDDASLQSMARELGRWPWPRAAYADLLDFFALAGAQTFAFDILFSEQQDTNKNNKDDLKLVAATQRAGNAVHAMQLLQSALTNKQQSLPEKFKLKYALRSDNFVGPYYDDFLLPIEALYLASSGIGFLEITPDRDGVYRRTRLFNQMADGSVLPSLASALALPLFGDNKSIGYDQNHAEIGNLKVPLDGAGNYLINPYGRIETYSAAQVIRSMQHIRAGDAGKPAIDPGHFSGKLVLLGASAVGLLDVKTTALASKEAGVFLHAYTLSNMLDQDFLVQPAAAVLLVILLMVCCISAIPAMTMSRLIIAILFPVTGVIVYLIGAYAAFSFNQLLPITPVIFASVISLLLACSLRTYHEKMSKLNTREMLRHSVSPSVLTAVIDSQEGLHAETGSTELLTILFSEIDSFTNISESLDAGKVVALLNIYLSDMTDVLFNHDGTLDKFIGEVIMAFWGAPVKTPNHPRLALECAIDMCRRLRQTNKLLTDNNYPSIDIGIGIHSGEVVLGNIGSEKISGYTVVGDNVNLASRLKGLSKIYGSPIIISETTWQAVRTSISCIRLDRVRVHGRLKPIDLYAPAKLFLESNNLQISKQTLQKDVAYAFDLFLQRDWKSAAESYSHLGECVLSNLFKERCLQYQAIDPGQKWDGVFVGSTK